MVNMIKIDYTIHLGQWLMVIAFIIMGFIAIEYDIKLVNECNKKIAECYRFTKPSSTYNNTPDILKEISINITNFTNYSTEKT